MKFNFFHHYRCSSLSEPWARHERRNRNALR